MNKNNRFSRGRQRADGTSYRPDFRRYETLKYEWVTRHPDASPKEYQMAMAELAQRCGI